MQAQCVVLWLSLAALACSGSQRSREDAGSDSGLISEAGIDADVAAMGDASIADVRAACAPGQRPGAAGATDGLSIPGESATFNVRVPSEYDPLVAWPLIVTYSPNGGTASFIESATGLSGPANGAGYIIAYVDTVSPTDVDRVRAVAGVADMVAEQWCVNRERTYLVGSSDGASVAWTIVLNDMMDPPPRAIAPFAAGLSGRVLDSVECRASTITALIMHNSGDQVFPMYGSHARDWLVACNECEPAQPLAPSGCVSYACRDASEVIYCEGPGGHGDWPDHHGLILDLFSRH